MKTKITLINKSTDSFGTLNVRYIQDGKEHFRSYDEGEHSLYMQSNLKTRAPKEIYNDIVEILTFKQYCKACHTGKLLSYRELVPLIGKVSKSEKIHGLLQDLLDSLNERGF